jgi:hypothetical protein
MIEAARAQPHDWHIAGMRTLQTIVMSKQITDTAAAGRFVRDSVSQNPTIPRDQGLSAFPGSLSDDAIPRSPTEAENGW